MKSGVQKAAATTSVIKDDYARAIGYQGGSRERTLPTCGPSLITPEGQRSDPTQFKARWYDGERREETAMESIVTLLSLWPLPSFLEAEAGKRTQGVPKLVSGRDSWVVELWSSGDGLS